MKAYKNLTIKLGLLNIPCSIAPLFGDNRIKGNYLCKEHMERITIQNVCPTCGPGASRVIGYPKGDGYTVLSETKLKSLETQTKNSIELEGFTPVTGIDPIWFDAHYILYPREGTEKAFTTLAASLRGSDLAGVGTSVFDKSSVPTIVRWSEDIGYTLLHTCHYPLQLNETYLDLMPDLLPYMDQTSVAQATSFVNSNTMVFRPENYRDEYQENLEAAINA